MRRGYPLVNQTDFATQRGIDDYNKTHSFDFVDYIIKKNLEEGTVVDLGCGNGVFLSDLKETFPKINVIGVDKLIYETKIDQFIQSDLRHISLPHEIADLVVSTVAFQWVNPDKELAYQEAHRLIKPTGLAVIYPNSLSEQVLREVLPKAYFTSRDLIREGMTNSVNQLFISKDQSSLPAINLL